MDCISEVFRKFGIYPFNLNTVDKTLLHRSCTYVDRKQLTFKSTAATSRLFWVLVTIY